MALFLWPASCLFHPRRNGFTLEGGVATLTNPVLLIPQAGTGFDELRKYMKNGTDTCKEFESVVSDR